MRFTSSLGLKVGAAGLAAAVAALAVKHLAFPPGPPKPPPGQAVVPARQSDEDEPGRAARGVALEELIGVWRRTGKPSQTLTIARAAQDPKDRGISVLVKGRFGSAWEGSYDPFAGTLTCERQAFYFDLNPEIPQWARERLNDDASERPVKLKLVLRASRGGHEGCPVVLTGEFYPGEVHWNGKEHLASAEGLGPAVLVAYTRTGEDMGAEFADLQDALQRAVAQYARATQTRAELNQKLDYAQAQLQAVGSSFTTVGNFLQDVNAALDRCKTAEDVLGLLQGAMGLSKMVRGAKDASLVEKLLSSDKVRGILGPKALQQVDRAMRFFDAHVPEGMATDFREIDKIRWEAARDTLRDMGYLRTGTDGAETLEGASLVGSANQVFDHLGDFLDDKRWAMLTGPGAKDAFDGLLAEMARGEALTAAQARDLKAFQDFQKWKGLSSDLDFQIPHTKMRAGDAGYDAARYATDYQDEAFLRGVKDRINQRLAQRGMSPIEDPADLSINSFSTNLRSGRTLGDAGQVKDWWQKMLSGDYLRGRDAYRTPGAQELALSLDPSTRARAAFTRMDGADIVYEMAARNRMTVATAGRYQDKKVFKDVFKNWKRALAGYDVAARGAPGIADVDKAAAAVASAEGGRGSLYQRAADVMSRIQAGEHVDPAQTADLASKLADDSDSLRKLTESITSGDSARDAASAIGRKIVLAEETGVPPSLPALFGERGIADGLASARRQWSDEIGLPWWVAAADPKVATAGQLGERALLKYIGNPYTYGLNGVAHLLGLYPDKVLDGELQTAKSTAGKTGATLRQAEGTWKELARQVDGLTPPDLLRRRLQEALDRLPPERRPCFESLIDAQIAELDRQYRDLKAFVQRIRDVRANFRRQDMVAALKQQVGYDNLAAEEHKALVAKETLDNVLRAHVHTKEETFDLVKQRDAQLQRYLELAAFRKGIDALPGMLPYSMAFDDLGECVDRNVTHQQLKREDAARLVRVCSAISRAIDGLRAGRPLVPTML